MSLTLTDVAFIFHITLDDQKLVTKREFFFPEREAHLCYIQY